MGQQTTAPDEGRAAAKRCIRPVWIVAGAVAAVIACIVFVPRGGPPSEVWVRDDVPWFDDRSSTISLTPGGEPTDLWWFGGTAFGFHCCERNPFRPIGAVAALVIRPEEHEYRPTDELRVVDGRTWRCLRLSASRPFSPMR